MLNNEEKKRVYSACRDLANRSLYEDEYNRKHPDQALEYMQYTKSLIDFLIEHEFINSQNLEDITSRINDIVYVGNIKHDGHDLVQRYAGGLTRILDNGKKEITIQTYKNQREKEIATYHELIHTLDGLDLSQIPDIMQKYAAIRYFKKMPINPQLTDKYFEYTGMGILLLKEAVAVRVSQMAYAKAHNLNELECFPIRDIRDDDVVRATYPTNFEAYPIFQILSMQYALNMKNIRQKNITGRDNALLQMCKEAFNKDYTQTVIKDLNRDEDSTFAIIGRMGLICQKQYDEAIGKMGISTGESTKVFNELLKALRVKEKKME